jgi:cyanobactin maturation PatA/PatG family protease
MVAPVLPELRPAVEMFHGLELAPLVEETAGDPRVTVAVLDGIPDCAHPCFEGAALEVLPSVTDAGGTGQATPSARHGTQMLSIIFGRPGSESPGIAPFCRGIVLPIFANRDTNAVHTCSQLDLARALLLAVERGANVINISGGQLSVDGEPEPLLGRALRSCSKANVLVIAAAGNDGCQCLHVPASVDSVLAVGAMNDRGDPLPMSNWGATHLGNGVLSPGERITAAIPCNGVDLVSGTSPATAITTGIAALLLSVHVKTKKTVDPTLIRRAILATATPCRPLVDDCQRILAGRINPVGALNLIRSWETNVTDNAAAVTTIANDIGQSNAPPAVADSRTPVSPPTAAEDTARAVLRPLARRTLASVGKLRMPAFGGLVPSDCGCGGGESCTCGANGGSVSLVYALGRMGFDYGSEARRDSFVQSMPEDANNPGDADQVLAYLDENPADAQSIIWTLSLDSTPIYAIVPSGPFAAMTFERLRETLRTQLHEGVELVSIPGIMSGHVSLLSGQSVPIVVPAYRGIFSWAVAPLVAHVLGGRPQEDRERVAYDRQASGLTDFLNRIYYDLRNLGVTAQDRALNYAATNAFQASRVVASTTKDELDLDHINVRKSIVCRPDSDCYDVELSFFSPENIRAANQVYRFTVDVSDVVPVTVGEIRGWKRRE